MSLIPESRYKRRLASFADWFDQAAEMAAEREVEALRKQLDRLGSQPVGTQRASEREQLAEYLGHRDNVAFWQERLQDPALGRTKEARLLRLTQYVAAMETLYQKYRDELTVGGLPDAATG